MRNNFELLQKVSGNFSLFPVIKANAYGHGASLIGRCLEDDFSVNQLPLFCVAQTQEALELRKSGLNREILVLSFFEKEDFGLAAENNFSLVMSSTRDLEWLLEQSPAVQKKTRLHLKFNTGMNRLGFSSEETTDLLSDGGLFDKLLKSSASIEGLMSHLARSEEDPKIMSHQQGQDLEAIVSRVNKRLGDSGRPACRWVHLANSASLDRGLLPGVANAGRPGLRLLGAFQDVADLKSAETAGVKFIPVLSMHAQLRKVFEVPAGSGVGYGQRFKATRNSLIGTLGMGYADGIRRQCLTQTQSALVKSVSIFGTRVPIVGTISMDMVGIDLSEHPLREKIQKDFKTQSPIWGTWIGEGLAIEEIAGSLGTISYEIFCGLNRRIKRSVVE